MRVVKSFGCIQRRLTWLPTRCDKRGVALHVLGCAHSHLRCTLEGR